MSLHDVGPAPSSPWRLARAGENSAVTDGNRIVAGVEIDFTRWASRPFLSSSELV
jgi:hypothetical protein